MEIKEFKYEFHGLVTLSNSKGIQKLKQKDLPYGLR